jgi:N-glycosylase/DNA lyase
MSKNIVSASFDIDSTINSGQVFLWEKIDGAWFGVDGQNVIKLNENPFRFSSLKKNSDFIRRNDDFRKIQNQLCKDNIVKIAVKKFPGLRLLQQDPFQCYISFIVSSNSSIPNIRNSLKRICQKFGNKIVFEQKEFCLFPTPETLADASLENLQKCGLGYRAKFVKEASNLVENEFIDFDFLKKLDYHNAKSYLLEVPGIGNKVADCILLFSLNKLEAFPLDRWMIRVLKKYYPKEFDVNETLTEKRYLDLHEKIVNYFGPVAGYSQQFLFKMERDDNRKKWL